ncbi:TPA: DUF1367 family protein [Yersinia enterocolitica]|uniref:DUF1367 family protein n=1 Tax=Yersinia enterocolitica TaxID=630 RepID=UPI00037DA7B6|nr:DUF1367 family protein [Yersinia enterocolitica]
MIKTTRPFSSRKKKTEVLGVLLPGGAIQYTTEHDRDTMRRLPVGTPIALSPVGDRRHLTFHRKFWKLIELGYMYWIPNWQFVSASEEWIAHEVAKAVGETARDPTLYDNATKSIAESVLARLARQRQKRFDSTAIKSEAVYFNHVMVKAGFYDLRPNPEGGTLKQRWSIAFAKMDQTTFEQVYKGVARVIWHETLSRHFASKSEMVQAVNRLMGF